MAQCYGKDCHYSDIYDVLLNTEDVARHSELQADDAEPKVSPEQKMVEVKTDDDIVDNVPTDRDGNAADMTIDKREGWCRFAHGNNLCNM